MEKSLFGFIWKHSKKQQFIILLITMLSFPVLYMSLELPKQIINEAIGGSTFPKTFLGFQLDQVPFLLALCFGFLGLVVVNNGIKWCLNVYKGLTGERVLRRLRYQLYERVLRFRLPHFRKISSGEIIPMITAEVQDLGGFAADAFALPAFQGGTLLVYIVFIFVQDPILGAAAISLYPIQAYIIPKLQRKVNALGKRRVRNLRQLSERVSETIAGITEIHANDTSAYHIAEVNDRLHENFEIRFEIFRRKFTIKFINNFLNQLTPFMFYAAGGYLVIIGEISFGALVAVLAAYKDLAGPWKELLGFYQQVADANVKYDSVIEQFDPQDIYPEERLSGEASAAIDTAEAIEFSGVGLSADGSGPELAGINAALPLTGTTAIIGPEGSGTTEIIQLASGLLAPTSGRAQVDGTPVESLPEAVIGRAFAYLGPSPHIFTGTLRQNIVYGLQRRPVGEPEDAKQDKEKTAYRKREAELTGAPPYDLNATWLDLEGAGVLDADAFDMRLLDLVTLFGLGDDVFRMGMQSRWDASWDDDFKTRILQARALIAERADEGELGAFVDLWAADKYNRSATVADNLLFGMPASPDVTIHDIAANPVIVTVLKEAGLADAFVEIGRNLAETMVELFAQVKGDNELLDTFSFIPLDELPAYEDILARMKSGKGALSPDDRASLTGLALMLIPTKHRLGLINEDVEEKIVGLRGTVRERLETSHADAFVFFEWGTVLSSMTVEENLLFGRPRFDRPNARETIETFIREIVAQLELRGPIVRAGLGFHAGVSGSRLSAGQKLRVALVRTLVRRPRVLFLDGVLSGNGSDEDNALLDALKTAAPDMAIIAAMERPGMAARFDHVFDVKNGTMEAADRSESQQDAAQ
ncbi:MAG: ABC transporter transmembrane domain-containing protein [Pseudomonadota bacterium]